MPKVSVIVATYNHEKYIAQALESIVKQKCDFTVEALVGDDASRDKTSAIVAEYGKKYPDRIKPVLRKKNLGAFRNIKDLFERATGDYIALLEGDDYWITEDKLQKQVDFLDAHPEYAAHFFRHTVIDEHGERNCQAEQYLPAFSGGEYTIRDFEEFLLPGQTATAMYRRSTMEDLMELLRTDRKVRPRLPLVDRFLVLGVLHMGRIYTDPEQAAAYRFVLASSSGSWSSKNEGYSLRKIIVYLFGLHEFERIAKVLGLDLNFDERRRFEYRKASRYRGEIPGVVLLLIKCFILLWYTDKKDLLMRLPKKIRKRIKRVFHR